MFKFVNITYSRGLYGEDTGVQYSRIGQTYRVAQKVSHYQMIKKSY